MLLLLFFSKFHIKKKILNKKMMHSLVNNEFDLKNKYSLKAFFISNNLFNCMNLNAIIVAHIHNSEITPTLDTLYVSADSITFHLQINDTIWYKLICGYKENEICNVSEYLRSYSENEDCWTELYDYENNHVVNEYRTNIKMLLKTCFRSIKTLYNKKDSDMIESPWFYKEMNSFEQSVSMRTFTYMKKYSNYIRRLIRYKQQYNFNLKRKILRQWIEWYYNPENKDGYMKKLRITYHIN